MPYTRNLGEKYSPLYFLNAFAAGGLAVSFYMYLFWSSKIAQSSLPTFDMLYSSLVYGGVLSAITTALPLLGFAFFSVLHVRLLVWNIQSFKKWRTTQAYQTLMGTTDRLILLAIPSTLSLGVIVLMITGLVVLPFLFQIIEFLFPLLFLALCVLGLGSLRLYRDFFVARLIGQNHGEPFGTALGQMLAILAFAMIGLAFSILAAISTFKATLVLSYSAAVLCLVCAAMIGLIRFASNLRALTHAALTAEVAPLFWFGAALLSVLMLGVFQLQACLAHAFGSESSGALVFAPLVILFVLEGLLFFIGTVLMKQHGFLANLLKGGLYSPGLYAVIAPALGLGILYSYLLNGGLVESGLLQPFSTLYLLLHLPLLGSQLWLGRLLYRLNTKVFGRAPQPSRSR